jgi:predicted O-methyltransferase YrrM
VGELLRALDFSRERVARVLKQGDRALDATCGNGKDTVFLAGCVGARGKVYAFDIQEQAVTKTRELLAARGMAERVALFLEDHARLLDLVQEPLGAAMFNLGYLPGSDHGLITRPKTTLPALKGALSLLVPGGLVSVVAYRGHPGGQEEANRVQAFLESLAQHEFSVLQYRFLNQANDPPELFLVEKL